MRYFCNFDNFQIYSKELKNLFYYSMSSKIVNIFMNCNPELKEKLKKIFTTEEQSKPESYIGFLIWQLSRRWENFVEKELSEVGMTHLQFAILVQTGFLNMVKGPINQVEISSFTQISPMQISQVVKILEKKGLIVRKQCKLDCRTKLIALSEEGVRHLAESKKIVLKAEGDFFGSQTDKLGAEFLKVLLNNGYISTEDKFHEHCKAK